jgi:hypothetical protein
MTAVICQERLKGFMKKGGSKAAPVKLSLRSGNYSSPS